MRSQQITAPSEFISDGLFKDVSVDVTDIYAVVKRTFSSTDKYFVELFSFDRFTDCAFIGGSAGGVGSGLPHIGKSLNVICDGVPQGNETVSAGGAVTFDRESTTSYEVGLPFTVYAKTATKAPAKTANFGAGPTGYGKTTTTFKAPGAPAAPTTPKTPKVTSGGATPDEQAKLQARIAAAAKAQPVAETIKQVKKMLETVQTKDDVAFIKKYINRQFSGQLSESADAQRSRLLNEVTRIGALRRRTHSQQLAR